MIEIIPAVLEVIEEKYGETILRLDKTVSLKDNWVHIDFADNKFVQNLTIEPEVVSRFPVSFKKEAHLMVSHPNDWIDKLAQTGFERVIFHIESEDNIGNVIESIKAKGMQVGLAINMDTPLERIEPFVSKIDTVLVMSIVPGFQGQPFIPKSLDRVRDIKTKNWSVRVGVDGSVKDVNAKEIAQSGVDFMTVGSFLLKGNIEENLEKLWEAVNE